MMKWVLFSPELYYVVMAAVFFFMSLERQAEPRKLYKWAVILSGVGVLATVLGARLQGTLFFDAYRIDLFSQVFKILIAIGTFWVMLVCSELKGVDERRHAEFYFLMTICTLAMMMLVSAVELLTITSPWNCRRTRCFCWCPCASTTANTPRPVSNIS